MKTNVLTKEEFEMQKDHLRPICCYKQKHDGTMTKENVGDLIQFKITEEQNNKVTNKTIDAGKIYKVTNKYCYIYIYDEYAHYMDDFC